jgi:heat shock protein HslJ
MMLQKNAKIWALILMAAALLSACGLLGQQGGASQASLEGIEWKLTELNGQPVLAGTTPTAKFEEGSVSGSTGCNSYGGQYSLSGESITISNLAQTEMACLDPEGVMDQETAFGMAMNSAASYTASESRLEIINSSGETVLVFGK